MRRAVATVSMSGTLRHKLEAIAAARFDAIELFEADFINFDGTARELAAMATDLGLGIDLYQPFRDFEGMPDAAFERSLDRAERKFDLMQQLGAPLMLVCSNTSPLSLAGDERAAAQLHELAERAARRNLRIGYEALAWGRHVNLYRHAWSIVERANHPHLGLILDSFHTLSLKDDPSHIAEIPGDKIFFVQMADAPLLAMDVLQWARHHRNFPGQGQFDVEGFFEQALLAGYSGTLSLEIFNDVFRETPNRRTAVDAMRSLLFLESQVRGRLESRSDAAAASVLERIELFDPPAPTSLGSFSFIEFAVDADGAVSLAALFQQMGFALAGRHRSKGVTLYRQGHISFIINAQPESDARARFELQGPTVCAIGITTSDAIRAVNRAVALQSARHDSPVGPNEQQVPAIRSPGGMVVHFVPSSLGETGLLEADFVMAAADTAKPTHDAGLQRVDHIALGLANDQLDTWVLFSRAVLALEPADSFELADPFGLIRSTGVSNADRSVRFVLNVSTSQRTRTARAVTASGGAAGVHHIALNCTDIFETVRALRNQGVEFVPISPNYFDDLATRHEVSTAKLEQLRELGILFDRSPSGDYFHIYTAAFADRFFFEIVQRADAYDGYGSLNAPARMASQANAST
ncbi:bifunctional sugar phosphate isomerase/epimerase/4-hydroxyphenylpyruvate dioxygenase family protein [soil metagenome]